MNNSIVIWVVVALVVLAGGYLFFSLKGEIAPTEEMVEEDSAMMEVDDVTVERGTYSDYAPEKLAMASGDDILLFFHADWCPICRSLEAEIMANPAGIPEGVHILKVEYDTATELKRTYGVTYQHTFVQVDSEGDALAKWGDAFTLSQVLSKIQ